MQTQCPHCKSQYSISAEQVDAYGGFVRCGKCNYKFNIHDQVLLHRYRNKQRPTSESSFKQNGVDDNQRIEPQINAEPDDGVNIRFRELEDDYEEDLIEPTIETDETLDLGSDPIFSIGDEDDGEDGGVADQATYVDHDQHLEADGGENDDELEETLASLLEDEQAALDEVNIRTNHFTDQDTPDEQWASIQDGQADAPVEDWSEHIVDGKDNSEVEPEDQLEIDNVAELESEDVIETDDTPTNVTDQQEENHSDNEQDVLPSMAQIEEASSEALVSSDHVDEDNEDEDGEAPVVSLINDEAEIPERSGISPLMVVLTKIATFLFWTVLSIALAYVLFGQIKDKLYPAYKDQPAVQAMRAGVCEYLPCTVAKYDIDAYEIVVSRMDEIRLPKRNLHISIFMINKSAVEQVYPRILITLKRLDGSIAGQRVIEPVEYFKSHDSFVDARSENGKTQVIKPNKLGKVLIKLNNPPSDAVGFEAKVVQ